MADSAASSVDVSHPITTDSDLGGAMARLLFRVTLVGVVVFIAAAVLLAS